MSCTQYKLSRIKNFWWNKLNNVWRIKKSKKTHRTCKLLCYMWCCVSGIFRLASFAAFLIYYPKWDRRCKELLHVKKLQWCCIFLARDHSMHIVEGMGSSRLIWNNNKNTTKIFRPRIKEDFMRYRTYSNKKNLQIWPNWRDY